MTRTPVYRAILALLQAREGYDPTGDGRPGRFARGLHLIVVAAALARTPDVPLPDAEPSFRTSARVATVRGSTGASRRTPGTAVSDGRPHFEPVERAAQQARDVHLRDADELGDLGLGEVALEAKPQDQRSLAGSASKVPRSGSPARRARSRAPPMARVVDVRRVVAVGDRGRGASSEDAS